MAVHPEGCDCGSYACELRNKGIQVSAAGMVRHNRKPPSPHRYNQWEKGKAGEHRADGTWMPYLDKHGSQIPIKTFSEGKFDKAKERLDQRRARDARSDP